MNFSFNSKAGVTLPGNIGALSEELILTDTNDGGIIIKDIQQDSPVARAGTLKKGDQLNAVTIHFDNLTSEEVSKILKYSEQYKTSLKLNAKEELRSPDFRLSSPDMGSGDQAYLKLYNSKIKPHLKLAKPNLNVGSRNGEANVKNKTSSFGVKEPRIYSPDIDMKLKATKDNGLKLPTSRIDLEAPNIQAEVKSPTLDVGSPRFKATTLEGKIKSPEYQTPSFSISRGKSKVPEMDVSVPDINTSDIDIGGVNIPETKANLKMPKVQMPSFGLSGPKTPEVEVDGSVKAPGFDVSVPNVKENFAASNVDIKLPKADVNIPDADLNKRKFTMPKFNMPNANLSAPEMNLNMKTPTVTSNLDVKLKAPNIKKPNTGTSRLQGPNVNLDSNIKLPKTDISAPEIKGGLDFKTPTMDKDDDMPDMNLEVPDVKLKNTGIKAPSLNLSGKTISSPDMDVKLPRANLDISAPKFQADVKTPNLDINAPKVDDPSAQRRFKFPKFKKPTFTISGNKPKMPELDAPVPDLKAGINGPDVDLGGLKGSVNVPDAKWKMPNMKTSSFGVSGPKGPDMDIDGSIKVPSVDVSAPNVKGNFQAPDVGINLPKGGIDTDIPDAEIKGGNFKLPGFKTPSGKLSLSGSNKGLKMPKRTVDLSAPDFQGDISGPSLDMKGPDIDINAPSVDLPEAKSKWKMPKFELPSFGLSGPKEPDVDVEGSVKTPGFDVSVPNLKGDFAAPNVDVNLPKADFDANIPAAELKAGKFKMPKFNMPSANLSAPDMNLNVKAPTVTTNLDAKLKVPKLKKPNVDFSGIEGPNVNLDGKVKLPKADLSAPEIKGGIGSGGLDFKTPTINGDYDMPDMDLEVPDVKLKGSGIKKPSLNMSAGNISIPDMDVSPPKGNIDVTTPKIQTDVKTPNLDINTANAGGFGAEGKLKFPKFKKPTFSISGNKPKMPELNTSVPDLKAGINGPDVDLGGLKGSVDVPDAKWKMLNMKMPSFGVSGPKGTDVDIDGSIKAPGIGVTVPNVKGDFQAPDVDINPPKGDIDANIPDAELKGRNFKLPGFKMPSGKLSLSSSNKDLKMPKDQLELSTPDIQGDISGPDLDMKGPNLDLNAPIVDLPEAKSKRKMPKLELPLFNLSGPKGPDVDFDGSVNAPGIDVSGPNAEGKFQAPDIDINLPKGNIDANIPDAELKGGNFKLPDFKMPSGKLSLSGTNKGLKMPKGEVDLPAPDFQGNISDPSLGMKGPNIDIKAPTVDLPEAKSNWKMPKLELPSFNLSKPKGPDVNVDGSVKAPGFNVSGPNVKGNFQAPDVDINLPKGGIDADIPDAEIKGGNFKLPGFKTPSGKLSLSGSNKGLKMPKRTVDLSAPDFQGDISGPSLDMKGPDIDINAPSVDLPEAKSKWKMPKFELPSFGLSGSKGPDVDVEGSVKTPGFDVSVPNLKGDFAAPNVDVNLPKADFDANIPAAELKAGKFKMPKFNMPSANLSAPDMNLNVKAPTVTTNLDAKLKVPKLKKPNVDFSGIEGPNVNLDGKVKLPKADLSAPEIKGGMGSGGLDFKTPTINGDYDMPDMDLEVPDVKLKGSGIKKPSLNMSAGNISIPDMDVSPPKGNIDVTTPKIQTDVKTPNLDINTANAGGFGAEGKLKFPKFKKPTFSISGNKPKMPELNTSVPDLKAGINGPDVDLGGLKGSVDVPDAKWKMLNMKMQSFGVSGPKGTDVDIDGSIKAPGIDVTVPNVKGNFQAPDVDINLPKGGIDANIRDAEVKGGNFKLPGLKMPKGHMDISAPDFQGKISGPSLDVKSPNIDINASSIDLPEAKSKVKMPKMELSSFDLSGPKGPDVDFEGSVKTTGVNVSIPNSKGNFAAPNVDIKLPKASGDLDVKIPTIGTDYGASDLKLKVPDRKVRDSSLTVPSLNMPSGNVSIPDMDTNLPTNNITGDANLRIPGAGAHEKNWKDPTIDMKGKKVNVKSPNLPDDFREVGVDVSTPSLYAQAKAPRVNVNSDENKFSRETFKIRSSSLSDLVDAPTLPKSDSNLKARTSSTLHISDDASSKKSKFKFGKLFNFSHKSKGSVDFTKAKAAASSGTFTSKFSIPELELSVSKD
ncbi:neuroblast differentiation-associated protein AHNAK [Stegostoma tigrinum]|uniref:neuroblast differentiation-associated protein AHNAK n=1 Tax=Stegostoma tigrinum TaxID=3053191 RepID=UPI0028704F7F|nr:neuroblast differentiation-associated protein AHNAK [Stegostoma tigrinum]